MYAMRNISAFERITRAELEQNLVLLRDLIECGIPTDRYAEHQLTEISAVEIELAKRHGG